MISPRILPYNFILFFLFLSWTKVLGQGFPTLKTDILHYNLEVEIRPESKSLKGLNYISGKALSNGDKINLQLSSALSADSILFEGKPVPFNHNQDLVEIALSRALEKGENFNLAFYYHGKPVEAANPPWQGGFVWKKDSLNRLWAGVTCEGEGASIWWPCKDQWEDEPDSMKLAFIVPSDLDLITNGKKLATEVLSDNRTRHIWNVSYPINHYNATFYLGHYAHFSDTLNSEGDAIPLDYFVLDYNLNKAKTHFKQVNIILQVFNKLFTPYPFTKDGYALVEAPYWGMEHQSAIAYGNNYRNDVLGLDFIIIHETAHEWWGNNVSAADHGEMWIQEAFATYSEALLFEQIYGKSQAIEYLLYQQGKIKNEFPMLGPLQEDFNDWPDADMYFKGSWMLHSLRNYLNTDTLWLNSLKGIQEKFRYSTISTDDLVLYLSSVHNQNLKPFFDRFLKFASPPLLLWNITKKKGKCRFYFKWDSLVEDFKMPFELKSADKIYRAEATTDWNSIEINGKNPSIDFLMSDFYYSTKAAKQSK